MTVNDIVSSIFKEYEKEWISPEKIREESNYLSDKIGMNRPGDPGRTVRDFVQKGFLERDSVGNCKFDSKLLPQDVLDKFMNYENVYKNISAENDEFRLEIPIQTNTELTEEDLGRILSEAKTKQGTYGVHYFALKYAKLLQEKNYNKKNIINLSGIGNAENWYGELLKGIGIYNLAEKDGCLKITNHQIIHNSNELSREEQKSSTLDFTNDKRKEYLNDDFSYTQPPAQIIYYGVPGSGKSHKIDHKFQQDYPDSKERENHTVRVVFHPEYTNADFVGQIMPSINQNGNVEYKFIPGPFAQILRRAYLNPAEKYCLVIEEINRGNAAAIFGDIFQLLDRFNKDEFDSENKIYSEGWSKYFVTNDFVNWYIRQNVIENPDQVTENGVAKIDEKEPKSINIGNLHFSANTGIRLPPNLSLYATMNTSDQNVFALDNAFQRRWDMELVENKFSDNDDEQKNAVIEVLNQKITWGDFQQTINSFIGEKSNESNLSSMEDKRLGCWFVKAKDGKINTDNFKNKVLKYLWDDAFKFSRQEVFPEIKTFEQLQQKFKEIGFKVFSEDSGIKELISPENNSETENSVDNIPHGQTEGNQE